MPKLTPEQQAAYDDMRASPGILIDPDGNVVFDAEAEATGTPPFKTRAEIEAAKARLQVLLAARRKEREAARGYKRFDFKARLARLHEPHIAPLTDYARRLSLTGRGFVPFFDPLDGGVNASVLFLFEKAGPTAQTIPVVSFDADNGAAVHARQFRTEARIPREWTVVWNLMPWWDGQRKYTAADRQAGLDELQTLFELLPQLRVVVLVGAQAAKAKAAVEALGFAVITSAHTSMLCRNGSPELFRAIPGEWAKVHRFVG